MFDKVKAKHLRGFKQSAVGFIRNIFESFAYYLNRKPHGDPNPRHVILVCRGNICRSAFAEHYLKTKLSGEFAKIESCGTDVNRSTDSPPNAVKVAAEFGVDLSRHASKGMNACDLEGGDLILPMEYSQYRDIKKLYPKYKNKVKLLKEFAPLPQRLFCNIYDPFGLSDDEFRRCFREIQIALDGLNNHLQRTNNR